MSAPFRAGGLAAALLALALAPTRAVLAQTTTLNGGGSSATQPIYDSLFTTYTGTAPSVLFAYDGAGSGAGQSAFLTNNITLFNSPSNQYGTFVGTTVHFGTSDSPLSSSQVSGYTLAATDGPLIQIPTVGTAVAQVFNNAGLKGKLKLTDSQLCGILSGKIDTWQSISRTATPGAIDVVYRSDSSGTTFLLTQHLNAVCTSSNSNFPTLPVSITKTFASLFPNNTPPANFTGESGAAAVASEVLAVAGAFGYDTPDFTNLDPKSPNTTSLPAASLVNASNNVAYTPTVTNIETGLAHAGPGATNPTPPSTQATAANPLNWVPTIPTTTSGYPIVGYGTWDVSSCYANATVATNIVKFLTDLFTSKTYLTTITNIGDAPLSNTAAAPFVTQVSNIFLSNKSGYNLNIGNATLCAGKLGR